MRRLMHNKITGYIYTISQRKLSQL